MDLTERYNKLYSDSIGMVPSERHGAIMSYLQKSYQNKLMPLYDALIQRSNELTP